MADKNLHDIKIDELDSSKKSPLRNILTLLALLFIILVISVVITKLILNTEDNNTFRTDDNNSKVEQLQDLNKTTDSKDDDKTDKSAESKDKSTDTTVSHIPAKILDRNLSSVIKTPLTSHVPKKDVPEIKTYSEPKKNTTAKKDSIVKKDSIAKKDSTTKKAPVATVTAPKKVSSKHVAKKEYIDKVVHKKNTTHASSTKKTSFLGGQLKKVSNSYYIKVGTYRNPSTVINKIKKNNFNYTLIKVENDKALTRVLIGPFFSRNTANSQLPKVKAKVLSGAYVTKVK